MDKKIFFAALLLCLTIFLFIYLFVYEKDQQMKDLKSNDNTKTDINKNAPSTDESIENDSSSGLFKKDIDKINEELPRDLVETKIWEMVQDYSIHSQDFFNHTTHSNEEISKVFSQGLEQTLDCLNLDYCGLQKDPSSPYFNPKRTPAHVTIIRLLEVVEIHQNDKLKNLNIYENALLIKLMKLDQDEITPKALNILKEQARDEDWAEILNIARTWSAHNAKAGFKKLLEIAPTNHRDELIEITRLKLKTSDAFTSLSILEGLKESQSLTFNEFKNLLDAACSHRSGARHNWLAITNNLSDIAKQVGSKVNPNEYCY